MHLIALVLNYQDGVAYCAVAVELNIDVRVRYEDSFGRTSEIGVQHMVTVFFDEAQAWTEYCGVEHMTRL